MGFESAVEEEGPRGGRVERMSGTTWPDSLHPRTSANLQGSEFPAYSEPLKDKES